MLPAAEAAGVHYGRCSIFFPASLIFVMDNGRGPFQDAYENALKTKYDLTYPRDANLCRQFWFTSSMSIYTDHVVTTWRYWYSTMRPMIVSTCFRPAVACLTSRDVVVMVSQWSIQSGQPRRSKCRGGGGRWGQAKALPLQSPHLHYVITLHPTFPLKGRLELFVDEDLDPCLNWVDFLCCSDCACVSVMGRNVNSAQTQCVSVFF